jgi:hypothetical protein
VADNRSFNDGYKDGYQSVRGKDITPPYPSQSIPAGKSPYEAGYERGQADAEEYVRQRSN